MYSQPHPGTETLRYLFVAEAGKGQDASPTPHGDGTTGQAQAGEFPPVPAV